jgi:hypothetical protein
MSDHLVEPIAQAVLRPFPADLRAVSPADEAHVEQAGIRIDLIPDHAAAVSLMWKERAPPASGVGVGTAVLTIRDAQFLYSLGDNHVEVLGVPLGEVPGVRRRVVPHGPGGGRCADQGRRARPQLGGKGPCSRLDSGEEIAAWGHAETVAGKARRGKKASRLETLRPESTQVVNPGLSLLKGLSRLEYATLEEARVTDLGMVFVWNG